MSSTISSRIRQVMEEKDLKQTDLVRMTGINKSSIYYYCSGEYEPKGQKLYAIANALGVSPAWLMGAEVNQDGTPSEDDEILALRDVLRRNPETRALFKLARNATTSDIRAAIAVLESLKGTRDE